MTSHPCVRVYEFGYMKIGKELINIIKNLISQLHPEIKHPFVRRHPFMPINLLLEPITPTMIAFLHSNVFIFVLSYPVPQMFPGISNILQIFESKNRIQPPGIYLISISSSGSMSRPTVRKNS